MIQEPLTIGLAEKKDGEMSLSISPSGAPKRKVSVSPASSSTRRL